MSEGHVRTRLEGPWREPLDVAADFADEPGCAVLLSDGSRSGAWSYVLRQPTVLRDVEPKALRTLLGEPGDRVADGPPFQGGLVGLASYELGARFESAMPQARGDWPDLVVGVYPSVLAFDHQARRVIAIGAGASLPEARRQAEETLEAPVPSPLAESFQEIGTAAGYAEAVGDVTARIASGDIFQANIARRWSGRLARGARPFDVFARLARQSPAPFAAYLRLPHRALVSNSPERFLAIDTEGRVHTCPIKGTRPRGESPGEDAALARALLASDKDRAENLMIVDLMRNDLARTCVPGSIEVPRLCALESFANVHHLVSRVEGALAPGRDALDAFFAAFPPGSITGAPKIEAMKVIARHEPPRGPFFGSLFWADSAGGLDSSVLIRTLAFDQASDLGWTFETRAGGGIVADSDPWAEAAEAEAKVSAIRDALTR